MRILLPIILFFIVTVAQAQDPQFSQFYNAPLYLNPGFTGITPQQRVAANHRIQWPNLPQAFATYALSYDFFAGELKSGFGLMVTTDKMGSGGWRTTTAGLLYSYKLRISDKWVFSPGIYFGYGQQGIDQSKLRLGDELLNGVNTNDPDVRRIDNESYFDFGSGIVMYNKSAFFGVAAYHMNQPNVSLLGAESRLPMKINVHGGFRIPLYNGPKTLSRVSYLTPGFVYRKQGDTFNQLDLGLQYHIDPISIGVWYRGVPLQRTFKFLGESQEQVKQDALIFMIGLLFKNFNFGYSYDFTISELSTSSGGAHEISMVLDFSVKPFRRGVKRKNRLIPCPSFNSKDAFWN